jgi:hypothetical protein
MQTQSTKLTFSPRIDNDRRHAKLGCAKGSGIPRRTSADDDQISFLREFADDHW